MSLKGKLTEKDSYTAQLNELSEPREFHPDEFQLGEFSVGAKYKGNMKEKGLEGRMSAVGSIKTETRYMRRDTYIVNGLLAYKLSLEQSWSCRGAVNGSLVAGQVCYWGIRVWIRHPTTYTPPETEITNGTPVIICQRSEDGSGMQHGTFDMPTTIMGAEDALLFRTYMKVGTESWSVISNFLTEQLCCKKIVHSIWDMYFWTQRSQDGKQMRLEWGYDTCNSRVENFKWQTLLIAGKLTDKGAKGVLREK